MDLTDEMIATLDRRIKETLARGPMVECRTCVAGNVVFASEAHDFHALPSAIERLAAARIIHLEGAPGARIARLTS